MARQNQQTVQQPNNNTIMNFGNSIDWNLVIALIIMFYFYPSMVAGSTWKSNVQAIFITNFLLGWTGIVWLICLMAALIETKNKED